MKRLHSALITAIVLLIVGWIGKDLIVRAAVTGSAKAITGLETHVDRIHAGLLSSEFGVHGLRVSNPSGFPHEDMVNLPDLYVRYDLGSFLKGKPHLRVIRLHLAQFTVAKAADGRLNLNSIKALQSVPAQSKKGEQPKGKPVGFQIDVLELKVGKVVYKDYTTTPPQIKEFAVNIDERYEHIANPYTFAGLVVSRTLVKTTVARLTSFDLAGLQAGVNDALKASTAQMSEIMTRGLGTAQDAGKSALGNTQEILRNPGEVTSEVKNAGKQALDTAKDAAKVVKKLFGGQ